MIYNKFIVTYTFVEFLLEVQLTLVFVLVRSASLVDPVGQQQTPGLLG